MFSRGVALCSVLALASIAQGGVTVQLVATPSSGGPGCDPGEYEVGQQVSVEVRLVQNPVGSDQLVRLDEFDFQQTAPLLLDGITFPTTHDRGTGGTGDDIHFWKFDSLTGCTSTPAFCGFNHYIDDDLPAGLVDTRPNVLSMAYYGLNADNTAQLTLKGDGTPLAIGVMDVTMPALGGSYNLNVLNAADTDMNNRRARVDFGFEPHTIWCAGQAAPNDVSGGTLVFNVVAMCDVGCVPNSAALVSSIPPFVSVGQSTGFPAPLWRTLRHVIRLDFSEPANCPALTPPTAGQILIREMLANGAFGSDLSASFTYTIEAGNVLRVREPSTTATVLLDNKWYAISNNNWPGVAPFEAQFAVNVGDFDGNRFTTPTDVSGINAAPGPQPDQGRADVNGDGFKTPTDVSIANSAQGPPPAKPTGH